MESFPVLHTERLILNRPTYEDRDDFVLQINSTEDFSKNLFNITYPYSKENYEQWLPICDEGIEKGTSYRFAIRENEIGKLIGLIGLHIDKTHQKAELGYWLGKDFWGNGYLTETVNAVLKFGFEELSLNKIYATHFLYNPASEKVMQKSGMRLEGLLRKEYFHHGEFLDVNRYSILKEDFQNFQQ